MKSRKEYHAAYYQKNKEYEQSPKRRAYQREYQRRYRQKHHEKVLAWDRARYQRHKEKRQVANREWRKKCDPEKRRAYYKQYYRTHRNKWKAIQDKSRAKHKERVKASHKKYRQEHLSNYRTYANNRWARILGANGQHTEEQWVARFIFHGQKCRYCGRALTLTEATKDHAISLKRGGTNWASNLVPACKICNSKKGEKTIFEFLPTGSIG